MLLESFKVLIVDDNPDNVDLLERRLRQRNYTFLTASNGLQALEQVQIHMPDLVLLDVNMPVLDGFEVCRRMRADKRMREIPVIIITAARGSIDDRLFGLGLGADDYLIKPYQPQRNSGSFPPNE